MAERAEGLIGPALPLAVLAASTLTVVDPIGWDRYGPLRWLLVPALGWLAVVAAKDRVGLVRSLPRPVTWLVAVMLASVLVAAIFAADPLHAWLGTPDRRFGAMTWLLVLGVFVTSATFDGSERTIVLRGVAVGAVGLGLYTIAELLGLTAGDDGGFGSVTGFSGGRAGGPFGQPAYLGAAATLAIPMSLAVGAAETAAAGGGDGGGGRRSVSRWSVVGFAGGGLASVALLASQSRAAWVGVVVAALVWFVAWPARRATNRATSNTMARVKVLGAVGGLVAITMVAAVGDLRSRITGSFGTGGVIDGRLDEWRVGLRALADAPLLGYGPEGYRTVFGANVDDDYVIAWGRDVITDRAHSGPIDTALAIGGPGALAVLAVLALVAMAAVRAVRSGRPTAAGPALAVIAYGTQQLFLFPLSELDPLFWAAAGLTITAGDGQRDPSGEPAPAGRASMTARAIGGGLAVGLAIIVTVAGLFDLAANALIAPAIEDGTRSAEFRADRLATASRLRPDSIRYLFIGARVAAADGDLGLAIELIDDGLDLSPDDPALLGEAAKLRLDLARALPAGETRAIAIDDALRRLEALVATDPRHPAHLQRLGIAQALDGDLDAAAETLERAVGLAPDQLEPRQNLDEVRRLQEQGS